LDEQSTKPDGKSASKETPFTRALQHDSHQKVKSLLSSSTSTFSSSSSSPSSSMKSLAVQTPMGVSVPTTSASSSFGSSDTSPSQQQLSAASSRKLEGIATDPEHIDFYNAMEFQVRT
jgi:hypothetical protein